MSCALKMLAMWEWKWLVVSILIGSRVVESMRFELQSGEMKCIAEEIKSQTITVGTYSVVDWSEGDPKITVKVDSPYGTSHHVGENVEKGTFAFTASETGDHSACFQTPRHTPVLNITVDFVWRSGVAARDWSTIAKRGKIDAMELELRKLYETVRGIHDEIYYLREREEEMQVLNRKTDTNMLGMGLLFLVICLAVAGLHLWHLKTYFERKKLL
ncbi:Transmembrane emp24 domain-containing protein p24delta9 [Linum grandiflorum]